jgi:ribose 5-phosphate isomerase B
MVIHLGADHGGVELKEKIKVYLLSRGYLVHDHGAHGMAISDDYPAFAFEVAEAVARSPRHSRGILACRTGTGMGIAAAKVFGIRPVEAWNPTIVRFGRKKNDANVLVISADYISLPEAKRMIAVFLKTKRDPHPRHRRRLQQIHEYEKRHLTSSR